MGTRWRPLVRLVVATHCNSCTWKEKGPLPLVEDIFLTLAVKLMPVLSTAGRRVSLCMHEVMVLLGCCPSIHCGAVEEGAFALSWPRIMTNLCSMYSHVPHCRWWRTPPLCWKKGSYKSWTEPCIFLVQWWCSVIIWVIICFSIFNLNIFVPSCSLPTHAKWG